MRRPEKSALTLAVSSKAVLLCLTALIWWSGRVAAQALGPPDRIIFLHYDYMVSNDPADPHSHAPTPAAIDMVVDAFHKKGITLFIDPQHTAIPEVKVMTGWGCGPVNPNEKPFADLKAQYFRPHGEHAWHYTIWGHYLRTGPGFCSDTVSVQGYADLPGYDFALGTQRYRDIFAPFPPDPVFLLWADAGLFMHELGHNLDLRHGGNEDVLDKPNYLSVMNLNFYFFGIASAATIGSVWESTRRVDYSDQLLPALDESHLNEFAGVGTGNTDIVIFWGVDPGGFGYFMDIAPGVGPVDWNENRSFQSDVTADINGSLVNGQGPVYSLLTGFDDWSHIKAFINSPDYRNGLVRQGPGSPTPCRIPYRISH